MQTIVATSGRDPEVHRYGCADVERGLSNGRYRHRYVFDVERLEDTALRFWAEFIPAEMSPAGAQASTRYMPCTAALSVSIPQEARDADRMAASPQRIQGPILTCLPQAAIDAGVKAAVGEWPYQSMRTLVSTVLEAAAPFIAAPDTGLAEAVAAAFERWFASIVSYRIDGRNYHPSDVEIIRRELCHSCWGDRLVAEYR
jgi:hypothetical protein